jgi:hypothetical protein
MVASTEIFGRRGSSTEDKTIYDEFVTREFDQ